MGNHLKGALDDVAHARRFVEEWLYRKDEDSVLDELKCSIQPDFVSCGAQSAYMILRYLGVDTSIDQVIRDLSITSDGVEAGPIKALLESHGLQLEEIPNATLSDLETAIKAKRPVLVDINDGKHWAVVFGFGPKYVYLADPSIMHRCIRPHDDFLRRWPSRWALIVSK